MPRCFAFTLARRSYYGGGAAGPRPLQSLTEHTTRVESSLGAALEHLAWLRNAAWAAAYDPKPYPSGLVTEASGHVRLLKAAIRHRRRPL